MRLRAVGMALAGLATVSAVMLSARSGMIGGDIAPQVTMDAPVAPADDPEPQRALQPVPIRARPVASDQVALPPVTQDALERIAEREPLGPIGRAHVPSEGPPKATILHRPVVVAAGLFQAQGHMVTLAGIEVTDTEQTCGDAAWPCGVHARTAFRNWLRGRALTCVVAPVAVNETVATDCTLGRQNPAEWLVSQGWARALPDGPYAKTEQAARAAGLGIFGLAPKMPVAAPSGGD